MGRRRRRSRQRRGTRNQRFLGPQTIRAAWVARPKRLFLVVAHGWLAAFPPTFAAGQVSIPKKDLHYLFFFAPFFLAPFFADFFFLATNSSSVKSSGKPRGTTTICHLTHLPEHNATSCVERRVVVVFV